MTREDLQKWAVISDEYRDQMKTSGEVDDLVKAKFHQFFVSLSINLLNRLSEASLCALSEMQIHLFIYMININYIPLLGQILRSCIFNKLITSIRKFSYHRANQTKRHSRVSLVFYKWFYFFKFSSFV